MDSVNALNSTIRNVLSRALLCLACLGVSACSTITPAPTGGRRQCPAGSPTITIGTYNIFVGTRDLGKTATVIRSMNADVVALQEVLPPAAQALDREFSREYRYRYFSSGLGVMSRFPLSNVRPVRSQRGINGFLFADLDYGGRRLQFANIHLDPLRIWTIGGVLTLPWQLCCGHRQIQRDEFAQIAAHLRQNVPSIVAGDFNRTDNRVIKEFRRMGYVDTFAAITNKPDRIPTLHLDILGLRSGRRIDFILHDQRFQTLDSHVVPGRPSDHDAVVSLLCSPRRDR
jgi:endonuclease/exonuclease/phosphatase family metal-dependent hydrolase